MVVHGRFNLLATVVHESGKFTLIEDIFMPPTSRTYSGTYQCSHTVYRGLSLPYRSAESLALSQSHQEAFYCLIKSLACAIFAGRHRVFGFSDTSASFFSKNRANSFPGEEVHGLHLASSMLPL